MMAEYQAPENPADQVKLLFNTFDKDRNGSIEVDELKKLLQSLDPDTWTDDAVSSLLEKSDDNGDGTLQFTEFWAWIAGHGGETAQHRAFRENLLEHAIEEDKERFLKAKGLEQGRAEAAAQKAERDADRQRKEDERAAGLRVTRKEFVDQRVQLGMNRGLATNMFNQGDDDNDGEIDRQELGWLAADQATTAAQIKGVFKQSIEGSGDDAVMQEIVNVFTAWDVDGDGSISCEELVRVIQTLNPKLTEITAQQMIQQADTNGDGFIDVREFVAWISGMNPKKKKQKEMQEFKLSLATHMKRSEEAKELGLQAEFEEFLHRSFPSIADAKKIPCRGTCNTLNKGPSPPRLCTTCKERHAWICHGCGFVSYYDECINDCGFGNYGWTCLAGVCPKKKCGCKKKPEWWQRKGFVQDIDTLSHDVQRLICPPASNPAEPPEAA